MKADHPILKKQNRLVVKRVSILLDDALLKEVEAFAHQHGLSVDEVIQCSNREFLKGKTGLLNPFSSDPKSKNNK